MKLKEHFLIFEMCSFTSFPRIGGSDRIRHK